MATRNYAQKRQELEEAAKNPYVIAWLDTLAEAEIGSEAFSADRGYNVLFGGQRTTDLSQHPGIYTSFTGQNQKTIKTSAAGRYQMIERTAKALSQQYGITDFSPQSQDLLAIALMKEVGALPYIMAGDFENAERRLAKRWASLSSSTLAKGIHGTRSANFVRDSYIRNLRRQDTNGQLKYPSIPAGTPQSSTTTAPRQPSATQSNTTSMAPTMPSTMSPSMSPPAMGEAPSVESLLAAKNEWDTNLYGSSIIQSRYGNRPLLSIRPGNLNQVSGTLLTAALAQPNPPVPNNWIPRPDDGQITRVVQQATDRSTPMVRVTQEQPTGDWTEVLEYDEQGNARALAAPNVNLAPVATATPTAQPVATPAAQPVAPVGLDANFAPDLIAMQPPAEYFREQLAAQDQTPFPMFANNNPYQRQLVDLLDNTNIQASLLA